MIFSHIRRFLLDFYKIFCTNLLVNYFLFITTFFEADHLL